MNSAVQAVAPAMIKPNQILVMGRIDGVREWEAQDSGGYVTKVRLPAASEYDSAAVVEVSSRRKLGKEGEEIKMLCTLGGWIKRGKGEKGAYEIVNMRLTAVE